MAEAIGIIHRKATIQMVVILSVGTQ